MGTSSIRALLSFLSFSLGSLLGGCGGGGGGGAQPESPSAIEIINSSITSDGFPNTHSIATVGFLNVITNDLLTFPAFVILPGQSHSYPLPNGAYRVVDLRYEDNVTYRRSTPASDFFTIQPGGHAFQMTVFR